jgi:hypothetical protein
MLEIDTESSVTFLGLEEQNDQKQRDKVRELLERRKERDAQKKKDDENKKDEQ